ncbi:sulfotransferase 1C4-like [Bacillus rossius redtenbacheri]|uniref:sulfotransferase 1C4-like n=1 Tax=Bacillus rossius redtenbacheri TaxID=93214 RepID=UPI002FDD01D7
MSFPYEVRAVEEGLGRRLLRDFSGERTGFVQVGPARWLLPSKYERQAAGYRALPLRPDDVWVVTFPRSGTTCTQELAWLVDHDLDFDTARRVPLGERCPFLEFSCLLDREVKREVLAQNTDDARACAALLDEWDTPGYKLAALRDSPRHFKTHLPLSLLPPALLDTCKVLYVARNPKDVAVSYYHHNRLLTVQGYQGDFPAYWEYFQQDLLIGCPYWTHLAEAWENRNHPNMLFLFYEDISKDMEGSIAKVSDFLGKRLSPRLVAQLANHLHIDNFRNNPSVTAVFEIRGLVRQGEQGFIRNGKVGGNDGYFTPELNARANRWIRKNMLETGIQFPHVTL